ncbi:MAG: hypothetical protein R2748_33220 [Bryobacterales bacterium]
MTRKRLFASAGALAAVALQRRLRAQEPPQDAAPPGPVESLERRLSAIERVLLDRSVADATPASRALDTRLTRLEMRLERLEREIWDLRSRVGR